MPIRQMIESHPGTPSLDRDALPDVVLALLECAQACTACADACLAEDAVQHMAKCIRLDLDCADICTVTGRSLSRQTAFDPEVAKALLHACVTACTACAEECDRHAGEHVHCRICAAACHRCAEICRRLLDTIG
ncbi:four-helix bundle copper-binding protein [Actinomadura parmotrematis]|uniref:Four-helix bundle copper-binding protein n=1 Tax=Actinomadura parmotrematis TaxID=2864039 RepID=A0ABS7G2I9_9ACTN|nr:four-helix bundle copper-binding protein [Actinomadura parmotrematis]MBW8486435.1 four-helix bundle copper-binding protein [Actinomadura parmotrematis]